MLTKTQIKNRKNGVGASEVAAIFGLSPYLSAYELWMIKTGKMDPKWIDEVPCVYWGNMHEATIAKQYEKVTGKKLLNFNKTRYHPKYPFMLCHEDRILKEERKLVECKFAMFERGKWGEEGSQKVPLHYIIQVQYQLAVMEYEEVDLASLISGWDFRIYNFKRDEEIIKKLIEETCKFWELVKSDMPPPLQTRKDVSLAYPSNNGNYKSADENAKLSLEKIKSIRDKQKKLEEERKKFERDLTLFIGESEGISEANKILATWKSNSKGTRVLRINGE